MDRSSIRERAEDFIWRQARLLDRHLYATLFQGHPATAVLAALRAYQNRDGGFGNGLEPDIRTPTSQPVPTEMALRILDLVGFDREIVAGITAWLPTVTTADGGLPWVLPSVRDYPRAPWWETDDEPPASVNPTASIAGLFYRHGVDHPWLTPAADFCWRRLAAGGHFEVHEALAILLFLEAAPDRERAARQFARLGEELLAAGLIALDPNAGGYVKKVLEWAPLPSSLARSLFDEALIDAHLDALIAAQQPDGGWPISWPPLSPAVEAEWRGWETIRTLVTLRAYGRLDA